MAFTDFLTTSPYGTAQGPNLQGNAGVAQGPTWGQMLGAAMQYGSKPGSSAPGMAPLVSNTGQPGSNNIVGFPQQKKQTSTADVISLLMTAFGLGG